MKFLLDIQYSVLIVNISIQKITTHSCYQKANMASICNLANNLKLAHYFIWLLLSHVVFSFSGFGITASQIYLKLKLHWKSRIFSNLFQCLRNYIGISLAIDYNSPQKSAWNTWNLLPEHTCALLVITCIL